MKHKNFDKKLRELAENNSDSKISLEKYLLSLIKLIEENKNEKPSGTLFLELFEKAYSSDSLKLKKEWGELPEFEYSFKNYLEENGESDDAYFEWENSEKHIKEINGVDFTIRSLKRLAFDINKMTENGLYDDEYRGFGVESTLNSGIMLYNFEINDVFKIVTNPVDNPEWNDKSNYDWGLIAGIFEVGTQME